MPFVLCLETATSGAARFACQNGREDASRLVQAFHDGQGLDDLLSFGDLADAGNAFSFRWCDIRNAWIEEA